MMLVMKLKLNKNNLMTNRIKKIYNNNYNKMQYKKIKNKVLINNNKNKKAI